jgi:hypothetical protein
MKTDLAGRLAPDRARPAPPPPPPGQEPNREPIPHLTPGVRLSRSSAGMAVTTMTS